MSFETFLSKKHTPEKKSGSQWSQRKHIKPYLFHLQPFLQSEALVDLLYIVKQSEHVAESASWPTTPSGRQLLQIKPQTPRTPEKKEVCFLVCLKSEKYMILENPGKKKWHDPGKKKWGAPGHSCPVARCQSPDSQPPWIPKDPNYHSFLENIWKPKRANNPHRLLVGKCHAHVAITFLKPRKTHLIGQSHI